MNLQNPGKYDFVFVYEVKNRELETICLLKAELEKRGYKVKVIGAWDQAFHMILPVKTNVVIAFAMYNSKTLKSMKRHVEKCYKFVNMQWEQIFTNAEMEKKFDAEESFLGVSGDAKQAAHISWGEVNYNWLTEKYNVPKKNVRIVGDVSLDFLRPEFKEYYRTKDDILNKYKIPADKKILLFISSFGAVNMPETITNSGMYSNRGYDSKVFDAVSVDSQKAILKWFERMLNESSDYIIIYRPHPTECDNNIIKDMERKYSTFKCIGELSIKQWVAISDRIYMWWSTSIREVYAAQKTCAILRPYKIEHNAELKLYNNGKFITDYDDFIESLKIENISPIPLSDFLGFVEIDENVPSYIKTCDFFEEVYDSDFYKINIKYSLRVFQYLNMIINNLKMNVKYLIFKQNKMHLIGRVLFHKKGYVNTRNEYFYLLTMKDKNHSTFSEIESMTNKINKIIDK